MNPEPPTEFAALRGEPFDNKQFGLCLTHDVDRPYKTIQAPYLAIRERSLDHLRHIGSEERPYWQFGTIQDIEEQFGVRSSMYFLNEQRLFVDLPKHKWLSPIHWVRYTGHYAITDPAIVSVIRELDEGGWEIGLHGSYASGEDGERLEYEKTALESVLGKSITGGRQHFLNCTIPTTWRLHRSLGLTYDASLGSSRSYGFSNGYGAIRPFEDEFLVFPLTAMEIALYSPRDSIEAAKSQIDRLIEEAADNRAIMSVLWHVRLFNEEEFPGYLELYQYLITRAIEENAWIGPTGELAVALNSTEKQSSILHADQTGTL